MITNIHFYHLNFLVERLKLIEELEVLKNERLTTKKSFHV